MRTGSRSGSSTSPAQSCGLGARRCTLPSSGRAFRYSGPEGGRLFRHLVRQRKAVIFFLVVSTLTVVAGGLLYWRDSGGLDLDWIQTDVGTGFRVGAVAGLISWILVVLVLAPTSYRLTALGERLGAASGPPSQTDMSLLQALQSRLKRLSLVNIAFLAIATVAMATARYL